MILLVTELDQRVIKADNLLWLITFSFLVYNIIKGCLKKQCKMGKLSCETQVPAIHLDVTLTHTCLKILGHHRNHYMKTVFLWLLSEGRCTLPPSFLDLSLNKHLLDAPGKMVKSIKISPRNLQDKGLKSRCLTQ